MRCSKASVLIHAYLDDAVGPLVRRDLEAHLEVCSRCRSELDSTRALLNVLADLPLRQPGDEFDRRLGQRLEQLRPTTSPFRALARTWELHTWRLRPALAPLAALLAALAVWHAIPRSDGGAVPPPPSSAHLTQLLHEHEAGTRWKELPEQAVEFSQQVSSAATVGADLVQ